MSIVDRYVVRETASYAAAVFLVVFSVFLVTRLSSMLSDAVLSALPGRVVAVLLALRMIVTLPSVLPAVLYAGVLLALSRLARDQELTALEVCGIPPSRPQRTIIVFAGCAAVAVAFLSFSARSWAAARFNEVRDRAIAEAGLEDITPGFFYEIDPESHAVLFADARPKSAPEYLENVFIQRRDADRIIVFHAARALVSRDNATGFRFVTLLQGMQYDLDPGGSEQSITRYDSFTFRLSFPQTEPGMTVEKTVSVWTLMAADDSPARAELQWRAAMPVSVLVLTLMALPLSHTELRSGRSPRLYLAVLFYVVYRTLIGTAKNWVADGLLPPFPGVWLIHGAALVVALLALRPALSRPLHDLFRRTENPSVPS